MVQLYVRLGRVEANHQGLLQNQPQLPKALAVTVFAPGRPKSLNFSTAPLSVAKHPLLGPIRRVTGEDEAKRADLANLPNVLRRFKSDFLRNFFRAKTAIS